MIQMIEKMNASERHALIDFCAKSCIGIKAVGPLISYGTDYRFAEFWIQYEDAALGTDRPILSFVSKFYGSITVYSALENQPKGNHETNHETNSINELATFIRVIGYSSLVSNIDLSASELGKSTAPSGHIMILPKDEKCTAVPTSDHVMFIVDTNYKAFYDVLNENYPDNGSAAYEEWLVDFSHRYRHGTSSSLLLEWNGQYVGTAAAMVITENAVLLGAISTNVNCRGKHYAHTMVKYLSDKYENRTRYIMCKPDKVSLYEKAGFTCCGDFYRQ